MPFRGELLYGSEARKLFQSRGARVLVDIDNDITFAGLDSGWNDLHLESAFGDCGYNLDLRSECESI